MRRYKTCIREVTERACSMTSSSLTLIELNAGDASERDWIRFLLSDFRLEVIRAPDFSVIRPGALYSIYNHRRLSLPADFLEKISGADGCGLLHLKERPARPGLLFGYRHRLRRGRRPALQRRPATWLLAVFAPQQTAPTARPPGHRVTTKACIRTLRVSQRGKSLLSQNGLHTHP